MIAEAVATAAVRDSNRLVAGARVCARTPEEIRAIGLAVLKRELGPAGLIQFLQQFDRGNGDWASERRDWADRTTIADIRKASAKRKPRKRRA
jgi:hypothetical protein